MMADVAQWSIDKTRGAAGMGGKMAYPLVLTWINPDGSSLQPNLYLNSRGCSSQGCRSPGPG